MESKIDIIRFNDDNHAERIWANGKYIGELSDIDDVIENLLAIVKETNQTDGINSVSVYVCDDFEDFDEEDEIIDTIWDWFNGIEIMTKEQMNKVHEKDWHGLYNLI